MSRWLNYQQLLYLRAIARRGSLAAASSELRLSPQTLSEHVQQLERALGAPLFVRTPRGMELTPTGRVALVFADEVQALGDALFDAVEHGAKALPRLTVGVDTALPKSVVWSLLGPAQRACEGATLVCREGPHEWLMEHLRTRRVDVVLSSVGHGAANDHTSVPHVERLAMPLGWAAPGAWCGSHGAVFPECLDGAPVVLPTADTALRRAIDAWCARVEVRPVVAAEIDDPALALEACAAGLGAITLPAEVLVAMRRRPGLRKLGRCEGVSLRVFAYCASPRATHPGLEGLAGAPHEALDMPRGVSASEASGRRR